jgi:ectoine hydroxylase-related dioxygenase (phytanoyl-CoA dioxygenase family)
MIRERLVRDGYAILPHVFGPREVAALTDCVRSATFNSSHVMRSVATYAIRNALTEVPCLRRVLADPGLHSIVRETLGDGAFVTKNIWFEKPHGGNWFVGWHQDISISVRERREVPGYSKWTAKHGVIGVVPPVAILERTLTVRIHLDDADGTNGAVRVIPGSHRNGIQPHLGADVDGSLCAVPSGGVMLMRPLLMHASSRSTSDRPRRVLHLEFNDRGLDGGLEWAERKDL